MTELSPAHDGQPLVIRPHPFSNDPGVFYARPGQTIQGMIDQAAQGQPVCAAMRIEVGGYEVPRAMWARVRPKAGAVIHCTLMPEGGDSGKKWLRTILMIVVIAVATWFTGPAGSAWAMANLGVSGAIAGAVTMMVGSLIVNALVPPPMPSLGAGGGGEGGGQLRSLTGSSNRLAPYGPIPLVIGQARIYPPHAAVPYSETLGQVSYQRLMFDLGYGDVEVSDIRIGETPIEQFQGVQYEVTKTPTLYTSDVNEVGVAGAMNDGASITRTTAPNTDEISLDVAFLRGLFGIDKKGNTVGVVANISIEYRAVGSGTWLKAPTDTGASNGVRTTGFKVLGFNLSVRTGSRDPFTAGYAWKVPLGQYEVKVARLATDWANSEANAKIGDGVWTILRSIRKTNPSRTGTTKLVMRIMASEQLQGTLDTLSCVVTQRIKTYNRVTAQWSPVNVVSLNTAWVVYWLLTECPAITKHVAPGRITLESFSDYADFCTLHDFETRGVLDTVTTARQLINDVLACSLGALTARDGRYGVLFDSGTTVPSMVFTPLDTRGFNGSRVFTRIPHALKVGFRNPNANWSEDEIVIPDDGYSFRGVDARGNPSGLPEAQEFESIQLRMAADAHQAWRIGRHHFAQAKFRSNVFEWRTDIANLTVTRGDLIYMAHDVTEWGDGWGRVKTIVGNVITLDGPVAMEGATAYSVRLRKGNGANVVIALTGVVAGETSTFTLVSPPTGVSPGDVAVIGKTGRETKPLLITGIYPDRDLAARVTAVEYDTRVGPYWLSPPVSITSEVSGTALVDPPPVPNIVVVVSDQKNEEPGDGGATQPVVRIGVRPQPGYRMPRGGYNGGARYSIE